MLKTRNKCVTAFDCFVYPVIALLSLCLTWKWFYCHTQL